MNKQTLRKILILFFLTFPSYCLANPLFNYVHKEDKSFDWKIERIILDKDTTLLS